MQVYRIDKDGWYVGVSVLPIGEPLPEDCRTEQPQGFMKAKRNVNDNGWIEGLTEEEVEAIKNAPIPLTPLEELQKQQTDLVFELMMKGVL